MGGDGSRAVIQLSAGEARKAKIAASKEGMDRDHPVMDELDKAFSDDDEDTPWGKMRFMADSEALSEVAMKAQEHGKNRREKGHTASHKKYYSVGQKIQDQLIRQGEWVDVGEDKN